MRVGLLVGVAAVLLSGSMTSALGVGQGSKKPDLGGMAEISKLFGEKNWAQAEALCLRALRTPSDSDAWPIVRYLLTEVQIREGKYGDAERSAAIVAKSPVLRATPLENCVVQDAFVRAQVLAAFMPDSLPDPKDDAPRLRQALQAGNDFAVRQLALSLLRGSMVENIDTEAHLRALMALYVVAAREQKVALARTTSDGFERLAKSIPANAGVALAVEMNLKEMAGLRRKFKIGAAGAAVKSYNPGPDAIWGRPAKSHADLMRLGMSASAIKDLDAYVTLCRETGADSCLVIWKNRIVAEEYSSRNDGRPLNLASSTKSLAALLSGILEDQHKLDVEDPLSKYMRDWDDRFRARVKVAHLLNMTSGIQHSFDMEDQMGDQALPDMNDFVAKRMYPEAEPGSSFFYANYGVQLLSPILEKAAGEPLSEFARKTLFEPLGIPDESGFVRDSKGNTILFAGAEFRAREFARFGALVLHHGTWQGKHVISPAQIDRLWGLTPTDSPDSTYGRLWWCRKSPRSISMRGSRNNDCIVYPDSQLIIVRQQQWQWMLARDDYYKWSWPILDRLSTKLAGG